MPGRNRSRSASRRPQERVGLADAILSAGILRNKTKKRKSLHEGDNDASETNYIDSKASRKILKLGQGLQDEDDTTLTEQDKSVDPAFSITSRAISEFDVDSDEDDRGRALDTSKDAEDDWASDIDEGEIDQSELNPEDLALFNKFYTQGHQEKDDGINSLTLGATATFTSAGNGSEPSPGDVSDLRDEHGGTNLADLILEKIAEHEAMQEAVSGQGLKQRLTGEGAGQIRGESQEPEGLPPKVIEVYSKIGLLLSRYKSGPLPKPFKILPRLPASQLGQIIPLTRPDSWTPNAFYGATRIFISAGPSTAQQFLHQILLPRVRHDIRETHKLNIHLYSAMRKALYKPGAFFKGFIFPLLQASSTSMIGPDDGECTLREANIISSVLSRTSIPVLHSAAAMLRLTEIAADLTPTVSSSGCSTDNLGPFGAVNIFILSLLTKKYALPYKVVDALVFHFLRFRSVSNVVAAANAANAASDPSDTSMKTTLPVLWHQTLLAFAQRYRNDITEDQREALLDLVNGSQGHRLIGPEVRRELLAGRGRGVPATAQPGLDQTNDGDDTMIMT